VVRQLKRWRNKINGMYSNVAKSALTTVKASTPSGLRPFYLRSGFVSLVSGLLYFVGAKTARSLTPDACQKIAIPKALSEVIAALF
jgi:hypothetical protein